MEELREYLALAIFRAIEQDANIEFESDDQWKKRVSLFDNQPNPKDEYLGYADSVLESLNDVGYVIF